jgi:four helix bundle protein
MNIAEGSVEECRYFLILAKDLGYADTERLVASLEEVSRLLNAYTTAILASDFLDSHIPQGYQGEALAS